MIKNYLNIWRRERPTDRPNDPTIIINYRLKYIINCYKLYSLLKINGKIKFFLEKKKIFRTLNPPPPTPRLHFNHIFPNEKFSLFIIINDINNNDFPTIN